MPGDDSQVMYVWFEALLTTLRLWGILKAKILKNIGQNVQVIGKDIIRHHGAMWPGMLLGLVCLAKDFVCPWFY